MQVDQSRPGNRRLARCAALGVNVKVSKPKIMKQLHELAERGNCDAIMEVGLSYNDLAEEAGVNVDEAVAETWLKRGAHAGHAACMYHYSFYVDDEEEGREWLRKSARLGDSQAQYNLGTILRDAGKEEGGEDGKALVEEGVMWIKKAAEDPEAPAASFAAGEL